MKTSFFAIVTFLGFQSSFIAHENEAIQKVENKWKRYCLVLEANSNLATQGIIISAILNPYVIGEDRHTFGVQLPTISSSSEKYLATLNNINKKLSKDHIRHVTSRHSQHLEFDLADKCSIRASKAGYVGVDCPGYEYTFFVPLSLLTCTQISHDEEMSK